MKMKLSLVMTVVTAALALFPTSASAGSTGPKSWPSEAYTQLYKNHALPAQRLAPVRMISGPRTPVIMAAVKLSPSQAKSIALEHVKGSEFLDIRLVKGRTYIVKVMKDGRRIDVYVDANTGDIKQ